MEQNIGAKTICIIFTSRTIVQPCPIVTCRCTSYNMVQCMSSDLKLHKATKYCIVLLYVYRVSRLLLFIIIHRCDIARRLHLRFGIRFRLQVLQPQLDEELLIPYCLLPRVDRIVCGYSGEDTRCQRANARIDMKDCAFGQYRRDTTKHGHSHNRLSFVFKPVTFSTTKIRAGGRRIMPNNPAVNGAMTSLVARIGSGCVQPFRRIYREHVRRCLSDTVSQLTASTPLAIRPIGCTLCTRSSIFV